MTFQCLWTLTPSPIPLCLGTVYVHGHDGLEFSFSYWNILFLTCVDVGVLLHVRLLVEALPAVLAGIGPCVRVDQEVSGEGGGTFECLPTHLALKASFLLGKENHGMSEAARHVTELEE